MGKRNKNKLNGFLASEEGKPTPIGIALMRNKFADSLLKTSIMFGQMRKSMSIFAVYAESLDETQGEPAKWLTDFYDEQKYRFEKAQRHIDKAISLLNVEDMKTFCIDILNKSRAEGNYYQELEDYLTEQ